jgi:hypothetical protein
MAKKPTNLPAKAGTTAVSIEEELPDFMKEYQGPKGTENFGAEDVSIPRLKLAQSLTPEVKDGDADDGDFIHNITKEIIAKAGEPIRIIPIAMSKNYILWRDRKNNGGGIFARATRVVTPQGVRYAWDKPFTEFEDKIDGKTPVKYKTARFIDEDGLNQWGTQIPNNPESGPAATEHYNYIVILPDRNYEMIAISLSRTANRKAKDLNAMLKRGSAPAFGRVFELRSIEDSRGSDKFYNWEFKPAGYVQDPELFQQLERFYHEMKDRDINVDFSDGGDDHGPVVEGTQDRKGY